MVQQGELVAKAYNHRKVFVTGHTGFKGSWLICWLHSLGAIVKGFSLRPENEFDLYYAINGDGLCESQIGDIRDCESLERSLLDFEPDFIFHLAAQPIVRLSYDLPIETYSTNVIGTANLLNAVRKLPHKCSVVVVTTDKVYLNDNRLCNFKETDPLGGYDPYSASKAAAEIVTSSYRNCFFNPRTYDLHKKSIATARSGNVIGGGDWTSDRIVPDIVRSLSAKKTISIRNPQSTRPWQHVLDPLFGYLLLGAKMDAHPTEFCESYNFGPEPDSVLTVEELVKVAIDSFDEGEYKIESSNDHRHEAGFLQLDIDKAKTHLGWRPRMGNQIAIAKAIEWYKQYFKKEKCALNLVLDEINCYHETA